MADSALHPWLDEAKSVWAIIALIATRAILNAARSSFGYRAIQLLQSRQAIGLPAPQCLNARSPAEFHVNLQSC